MTHARPAALDALAARPIVVASHPRSGTHLAIDSFRRQFEECRSWKWPLESHHHLYLNLDALISIPHPGVSERTALRVLRRSRRPLIKTHLLPGFENWFQALQVAQLPDRWRRRLDGCRICYAVRDGRSVMCSYHIFHQGFDPAAHVPLSDFLRQSREGVTRVRAWANHVRAWREQREVHAVRFEDLVRDPETTLAGIAAHFDLTYRRVQPLLPRKVESLLAFRRDRLLGIRPESSAIRARREPKRPPGWRELFSRADRAFFHEETEGLLIELGYESGTDWIG